MSLTEKSKPLGFLVLMGAGSFFLAHISGQIETLLWGFGGGALLFGAVFVLAVLTGTLPAKVRPYDPKPGRFRKEHPILYGFLGALVSFPIVYLVLHVIPVRMTVFVLGTGIGFLLTAAIVAWRRTAMSEA
jgi:hypothetical protein